MCHLTCTVALCCGGESEGLLQKNPSRKVARHISASLAKEPSGVVVAVCPDRQRRVGAGKESSLWTTSARNPHKHGNRGQTTAPIKCTSSHDHLHPQFTDGRTHAWNTATGRTRRGSPAALCCVMLGRPHSAVTRTRTRPLVAHRPPPCCSPLFDLEAFGIPNSIREGSSPESFGRLRNRF